MKKLFAITLLAFLFVAFTTVKTYAQTQEPVKTEEVKKHCGGGHSHDATKASTDADAKPAEAPKSGCASVTKKCPSTCPHAKAAETKEAQPADNTNQKRTPVPQE